MIKKDLSKQEALNPGPKAIKEINFNRNIDFEVNIFFIIKELKESILIFS